MPPEQLQRINKVFNFRGTPTRRLSRSTLASVGPLPADELRPPGSACGAPGGATSLCITLNDAAHAPLHVAFVRCDNAHNAAKAVTHTRKPLIRLTCCAAHQFNIWEIVRICLRLA